MDAFGWEEIGWVVDDARGRHDLLKYLGLRGGEGERRDEGSVVRKRERERGREALREEWEAARTCVSPSKGHAPVNISYVRMPNAHQSAEVP